MKYVLALLVGSSLVLSGCCSTAKKKACAAPSGTSCCSAKATPAPASCCATKKN